MTCYFDSGWNYQDLPSYVLVYSSAPLSYCPSTINTTNLVSKKAFSYDASWQRHGRNRFLRTGQQPPTSQPQLYLWATNGASRGVLSASSRTITVIYEPTRTGHRLLRRRLPHHRHAAAHFPRLRADLELHGAAVLQPRTRTSKLRITTTPTRTFGASRTLGYPDGGSTTYNYTDTQGSFSIATRLVYPSGGPRILTAMAPIVENDV